MTEIAKRLGIGRSTLYRKMREIGLEARPSERIAMGWPEVTRGKPGWEYVRFGMARRERRPSSAVIAG